jgi:hypothetical protein
MDCIWYGLESDPARYPDEYRGYVCIETSDDGMEEMNSTYPDDESSDDISRIVDTSDDTSHESDTTEYDDRDDEPAPTHISSNSHEESSREESMSRGE